MDYPQLKIDNIANVVQSAAEQRETYMSYAGTNMIFPATKVLEQYSAREQQLRTTLWVLQVPILLMLAFYIFMVSQLIVQNDRNEIAVYKSRGASRLQILGTYLLQSLLLSGLAVALGPLVAMGICKVLGASNGFLELVSRTALPLQMRPRTLLYAGIAGAFTVVMMMAPVFSASGTDIVQHKQRRARLWKAPLWQKLFLDGILLGLSIYGLYTYSLRQQTLMVTAAEGVSVPIDPFLFIISTVFVLGAGLLFLRLYPLVVRLLSWAGRKLWPPAPYAAFVEVGRSGGRQQFLMLFLIFTVSVGIFSANSARTINQNVADKVHYQIGADLAVSSQWQSNQKTFSSGPMGSADAMAASTTESTVVIYKEPLYETYEGLAGTEAAAKVLMPNDVSISTSSRRSHRGSLMAVQPDQFGKVVWSDAKLLPHHINVYLNLMAQTPSAVIVSNQLLQDLDLAAGDSIYVTWARQPEVECVIYAGVEFWPGINPYTDMGKYFVVANLDYVQALTALEPYQVWYKRTPGATSAQIYDDMQQRGLAITKVLDANQQIIERKNDALLQGTNGAMTLGFVVTMAISMIGFFIYWILSIRARTLQFGILRAMGMSKAGVMGALLCEQVLISGAAIIAGVFIGGIMSDLFVPLLGLVYSAADQVPPFKVVAQRADYIRLYSIIGVMMGACMALLAWLISRIKVAQAIKLGED